MNTSEHMGIDTKIEIVEEFIQNLVDSGHKFAFIKSIILQALTRFEFMLERNNLDEKDPKFMKLYRNKMDGFEERVKLKAVAKSSWYSDGSLKDPWRDEGKFRIRRRGQNKRRGDNHTYKKLPKPPTTRNMFVPSSEGALLLKKLEEIEENLGKESNWKPKLVEKSGVALINLFKTRIPIIKGCPLGADCKICDGDAVKCSVKGSVYKVECLNCLEQMTDDSNKNPLVKSDSMHVYIGERSRPLRMRAREHFNNLSNKKTDSFMVVHWMDSHGLSMIPPSFQMKRVASYRDTFTRQISEALLIDSEGSMNKRQEYGSNCLYLKVYNIERGNSK